MVSDLGTAFRHLAQAKAQFSPAPEHFVPDLVLLGYVNEIEENAEAVQLLAASRLPHRAFPNVRAAFEAGQQALMLITDPDYDLAGARAWVYYLRRDREYKAMRRPGDGAGSSSSRETAERWFQSAVDEMAEVWNELAPGRGDLMHRARELVDALPRRPDNWAGVPIAPTLRDRMKQLRRGGGLPERGDVVEVYNAAYAGLTRESHPRTRLRPTRVQRDDRGVFSFDLEPRDLAAGAAAVTTAARAR